jgi:DNA-binding NarL/FixJ family response regulator
LSCFAALPLVRIVVVDDHAIVRECIRALLDRHDGLAVVGFAATGEQAIHVAERLRPALIIMDLALPGVNGTDAIRLILERLPNTRIVVLSSSHLPQSVQGALRAGASGYVIKEEAGDELLGAVRKVMAGEHYLSPQVGSADDSGSTDHESMSPWDSLSQRERQVLRGTAEGASTAQIALHLSLSPRTVDTYRSRSMRKLGLLNRSTLIRYAMQHP